MNEELKQALQEHQGVSKAVEQALTDTNITLEIVATMLEETANKFTAAAASLRNVNIKSIKIASAAIVDSRVLTDHCIALLTIETAGK